MAIHLYSDFLRKRRRFLLEISVGSLRELGINKKTPSIQRGRYVVYVC